MDKTFKPERRSRKGSGAVTLHDVAKLAGVAPISASRAINNPNQVSAALLEKVNAAVLSTGYVPNRMAGALASARSRLVAVLVPSISGPVFLQTLNALTEALAQHGYQMLLGQSGYTESREDALLAAIIGRRPDGIVLTGINHSPAVRKRLLASRIPLVETWDFTPTPLDMLVGFSHADIGRAVLEFLLSKGKRRLALIAGDDERSSRRSQALLAAARSAGLREIPVLAVAAPTSLKSGRLALADLLAIAPDTEAIFCSSDLLALGVMTEAAARGINVPGQLSVMGFGDLDFAADLHPALTTVRIDGQAIGKQAAQFIVERAEGRKVLQKVLDLGFSIVDRDSV
jgi:LacI family gluconate utilization system Gnt-I transcriptional repressor